MYQIVSDGRSRTEFWTDLREIPMRVFIDAKQSEKYVMVGKKHKSVFFRKQRLFAKPLGASSTVEKSKLQHVSMTLNLSESFRTTFD